MIYILLLEQGKIYVGYSERPIEERLEEHFSHNGSGWTKLYKPLQVLHILNGGRHEEDEATLRMMEMYGWWNVRGGRWCKIEINSCPEALLERQQLRMPTKIFAVPKVSSCTRCGRKYHTAENCYAKTHIQGQRLDRTIGFDDSDSSSSDYSTKSSSHACFKCGRSSHWARDCYAKSHINGSPIHR